MFSFFTRETTTPAMDPPALTPRSPREPFWSPVNSQQQSPFFSDFPAEIRNEIYCCVFDSEARELLSVEAHPLSFLLTCHKVYQEASTLAYKYHAFSIPAELLPSMSISLKDATSHLFVNQVQAITALRLDLRRPYARESTMGEAYRAIEKAMLVFHSLSRLELRVLRGREGDGYHRRSYDREMIVGERNEAYIKYAPYWFLACVNGWAKEYHAFSWREGESWKVEWPQLEDEKHLVLVNDYDRQGRPCRLPFMGPDAVGEVRGVNMCPCRCGAVEWTSADLVQETGRRVTVDTVYYGPKDRPTRSIDDTETLLKIKHGPKAIILRECECTSAQLKDQPSSEPPRSLGFDANDDYWEHLRIRNGDWGAMCRVAWRNMMGQTVQESFPGSKTWADGDWARRNLTAQRIQEMDATEMQKKLP